MPFLLEPHFPFSQLDPVSKRLQIGLALVALWIGGDLYDNFAAEILWIAVVLLIINIILPIEANDLEPTGAHSAITEK
jgi:hypothetical protein